MVIYCASRKAIYCSPLSTNNRYKHEKQSQVDAARQRGASPDGRARQFVNNSVERSANYFILGSIPVVYAAGDLVEIQDTGAGGAANNGIAPKEPGIGDVITAPLNIYAGAVNRVLGN